MIEYITKQDLEEAGVVVPDGKVEEFLKHANQSLAERIDAEVVNSLSEEEANEMIEIQDSGDDDALQAWTALHVPELIEIVQDEIDILLDELAA